MLEFVVELGTYVLMPRTLPDYPTAHLPGRIEAVVTAADGTTKYHVRGYNGYVTFDWMKHSLHLAQ